MVERSRELDVDEDGVFHGAELSIKPNADDTERRCKICGNKLSRYNLNLYCFIHQHKGRELEDKEEAEAKRKTDNKVYQKKRKAK